ncbi:MAG: hypothetical protein KatS3mg031_0652 [Chitinophagales bacterium]|nr:MAG: hypothetical protein KatS3mg031_0652 [Chitinophagales bacterium]
MWPCSGKYRALDIVVFVRLSLLVAWFGLSAFVKGAVAQDIHFSQYNASPLTLNPALTGFYSGDYRITANYRSQWGSITRSFRTIAVSAEGSFLKGRMRHDYLAAGIQFFNDKAGTVELGTNYLALSAAYRKALGWKKNHALIIGIQLSYLQQKLNGTKLILPDQYQVTTVNPVSSQTVNSRTNPAFDLAAGLLYHAAPGQKFNFYAGGAYYHILQPQLSFLSGSSYQIPPRYVGHAGARIQLHRRVNLLPSVLGLYQSGAWQANAGTYVQFRLNEDDWEMPTAFALGIWSRVASPVPDAVIIGARLEYWGFAIGFSYDVNISTLKSASEGRGAYELALIYSGKLITRGQRNLMIPCPQL